MTGVLDTDAVLHRPVNGTALLVVDMQNDFVREGAPLEFRRVVAAAQKLLDAARAGGMPVIFLAHGHRAGGADLGSSS